MLAQLFRLFVDIALWRRGPQDLPASGTLVTLVTLVYVFVNAVQVGIMGWDLRSTVLLIVIDTSLQALWLWGLLSFFALRPRFLQSFSAFLGVGALLTLLDILLSTMLSAFGATDSSPGNPWPFLHLTLVLMLLGHILQQALDRSLFLGMALTLVIMLTISALVQSLVPGM